MTVFSVLPVMAISLLVAYYFVILSLQFFLQGLFKTKHAARCCIISNLCINVCWCESQIEEQYSIDGKTINFVCKHVPLDVVDSDEVFCVRIPVVNLLCCRVS